jgi:hypothetical protein
VAPQLLQMKTKTKSGSLDPKFLMACDEWVTGHLDEMVRKYPGKVIAVYGNKLVAVADTYKEVFAAARAQGIKEQPLAMEVPKAEDFEAIL